MRVARALTVGILFAGLGVTDCGGTDKTKQNTAIPPRPAGDGVINGTEKCDGTVTRRRNLRLVEPSRVAP